MKMIFLAILMACCVTAIVNFKFADVVYDKLDNSYKNEWRVVLFVGFVANSIFISSIILIFLLLAFE